MTDWLFPALCGLLTGILSSWGVGGGTLLLLCMTLFFGVEQRTAQAINLLYFLPTAGISLFAHRKNGYLDKAVLRAAIPTGTLCALAAAFLTTMVDSSVFRKPFGLFLLYAGLSILFEKKENNQFVGIAKHLCGVATDYAIRCILNSIHSEQEVNGLEVFSY